MAEVVVDRYTLRIPVEVDVSKRFQIEVPSVLVLNLAPSLVLSVLLVLSALALMTFAGSGWTV